MSKATFNFSHLFKTELQTLWLVCGQNPWKKGGSTRMTTCCAAPGTYWHPGTSLGAPGDDLLVPPEGGGVNTPIRNRRIQRRDYCWSGYSLWNMTLWSKLMVHSVEHSTVLGCLGKRRPSRCRSGRAEWLTRNNRQHASAGWTHGLVVGTCRRADWGPVRYQHHQQGRSPTLENIPLAGGICHYP